MALTGSSWPQFTTVVVVFDKGNHSYQQMPLHPLLQVGGFHAGGAHQYIDPLRFGKGPSPLEKLLHVHIRHLDRFKITNGEW